MKERPLHMRAKAKHVRAKIKKVRRWTKVVVALAAVGGTWAAIGSVGNTTPKASASGCTAPAGALTIAVCGNQFVNQSGKDVVLRGANSEGTQYDCAESGAGFFDDSTISGTDFSTEIAAMKAWGINVVRVNLNEECWLGINGVPATTSALGSNGFNAYANAMGSYVSALNAAGIYAEVDLHLNAPGGELISDSGNDDFQNALPESNSDLFWKSVASYFSGNPAVIFGVFNEPFPPNPAVNGDSLAGWTCDLLGCLVPDYTSSSDYSQIPSSTYAGEGMLQMITDIRSVDRTTPLLVGGPDFAGDVDAWLSTFYPAGISIDPSNELAASVHVYFPNGNSPCSLSTNVATACPNQSEGALSNDGLEQVAAVAPVSIDEIGDFSCSAGESTSSDLGPFLASVDAEDASAGTNIGYVGWAWTTSGCDPNLITDWTTGQPSPMGAEEYCQLYLDGLNDGSLSSCAGTPTTTTTATPTTTTTAPPTTTTTAPPTTTTTSPPTTTTTAPPTTTTTSPPTTTTTTDPSTTTTTEPPTTTTTEPPPPTTTTTDPSTTPTGTTTTTVGSGRGGHGKRHGRPWWNRTSIFSLLHTQVLVPSDGTTVSGSTLLDAAATGGSDIVKVQFVVTGGHLSDQVVGTAVPTLYGWLVEWDTTTFPDGDYSVQSVEQDISGTSKQSAPISVTVQNGAF
jgi:hypothetical protein